jgi:hypothetical protein
LSLHRPVIRPRKHLKRVMLFGKPNPPPELLMDVNKPGKFRDSFVWA